MEIDKDDDFTFCQVSAPTDDEAGSYEQPVLPGIGNISINEEGSPSRNSVSVGNNELSNNNNNKTIIIKEEKVGSLSFNVITATPLQHSKHVAVDGAGNSSKGVAEQKPAPKKPAVRAKVPFEKGYSQMDWLKLTRTHPDLAGLKGQSNTRLIPMSEVKQNRTEGSMWTVLKGRVYNISPYMNFHPGGADILKKAVGKDCTSLFNKYHAWVNAEFLLEKCLVGVLDESSQKK